LSDFHSSHPWQTLAETVDNAAAVVAVVAV
jgi:hypothetical protein